MKKIATVEKVNYGFVSEIISYYGYITTNDGLVSFNVDDAPKNIKINDKVIFKQIDSNFISIAKSIVIVDENNEIKNTEEK